MNLLIDARRPLLEGILDFDAMGETGETSIAMAVIAYREAVAGPHGWVVGRFICPSSRLEELVGVLTRSMIPGERPWQVGVVIDEELGVGAMHAGVFHTYMDPAGAVASIELLANGGLGVSARSLATAAAGLSATVIAYAELGPHADGEQVSDLAAIDQNLIQPVGGLVRLEQSDLDSGPLATAILASVQGGVPLRVRSPLPPDAMLLRLLTAAALAHRYGAIDRLEDVMASSGAITATAVGLRWRDELFGVTDIKRARTTLHSWSCRDLGVAFRRLEQLRLL